MATDSVDSTISQILLESSQFHNPQLRLDNVDVQERILKITSPLVLTQSHISRVAAAFRQEIELGLRPAHSTPSESSVPSCSLLMINTFVPSLNTVERSQLTGNYISLDIGSTNFRVLYTKLCPGSSPGSGPNELRDQDQFDVQYYDIPAEFRFGTCSDNLFNFIVEKIEHFLTEISARHKEIVPNNSDPGYHLPLGFTFSFPMDQLAINVGLLKTWTKNYNLPDVVGTDVAGRLQRLLDQKGNRFKIRVVAILNDATGTLIKGQYLDPDCAVGVIFGTGHNACYLERVDRIPKWTNRSAKYASIEEVLVNMECGGFADNGLIDFVRTEFDRSVDRNSLFPGSFTFEKYLGGHFLGEVVRFILIECVLSGGLFCGVVSQQLATSQFITAKDVSDIETHQEPSVDLDEITRNFATRLGYPNGTSDDLRIVRYVCARVGVRMATLLATTLSVLVDRMERPRTVIAIDGSVYKKHPKMHQLTTDFLQEILDKKTSTKNSKPKFQLILAEDGSGKGAGIVAALSSKLGLTNADEDS